MILAMLLQILFRFRSPDNVIHSIDRLIRNNTEGTLRSLWGVFKRQKPKYCIVIHISIREVFSIRANPQKTGLIFIVIST